MVWIETLDGDIINSDEILRIGYRKDYEGRRLPHTFAWTTEIVSDCDFPAMSNGFPVSDLLPYWFAEALRKFKETSASGSVFTQTRQNEYEREHS